jgi:hypothetical protein
MRQFLFYVILGTEGEYITMTIKIVIKGLLDSCMLFLQELLVLYKATCYIFYTKVGDIQ